MLRLLIALFVPIALSTPFGPPSRHVIAAGTLLDGRGAVFHRARLVVEGTRILAIDPSASPVDIDLGDRTLMPGWIDTHVHLSWYLDEKGHAVSGGAAPEKMARETLANAEATLLAGFTTVQSLGSPIDAPIREAIARGEVRGPRVLTSVRQVTEAPAQSEALRALIRQLQAGGADVIKLFATAGLGGPSRKTMTDAQLRTACDEARALGLRAVVHAIYDSGARAAVQAGCTSIEHGTFISDRTLKLMAERGTWFDPNLLVWHNYVNKRDAFDMSDESVDTVRAAIRPAADALRRARALGVRIVFGSDAVAGVHGRNAEEFVYRVREAGERPGDVLVSATSLAAESLGLGGTIGAIAPGYEADLVATDGNPLDDITAVRRAVFVMKAGTVVRGQ